MAAVTVTAENTRIEDCEAYTGWANFGGSGAGGASEAPFAYQSSNACNRKVTDANGGGIGYTYTSDGGSAFTMTGAATKRTFLAKIFVSDWGGLDSTDGVQVAVGSSSGDYYMFILAGTDSPSVAFQEYGATGGYLIVPIDPNLFAVWSDSGKNAGTPNLASVNFIGVRGAFSSASAKSENVAIDALDIADGLYLVGGDGVSTDGTYQDFVSHDEGTTTNRYGYASTGKGGSLLAYGDWRVGANSGGAVATELTDRTSIIYWLDHLAAPGFSRVTVNLGHASTVIIDGATHIGAGTNTNYTPIADQPLDQVWQFADPSTYVDETTDANSATSGDWQIFPTGEGTDDCVFIGYEFAFSELTLDNAGGTSGVDGGSLAVVWEYYNGSAWKALDNVTDGTSSFTTAAADGQTVTFTVPTDWEPTVVNGSASLYYVRCRITAGSYSTDPVYDQGFVSGVNVDTRPDYIHTGTTGSATPSFNLRNFRHLELTSAVDMDGADVTISKLTQSSAEVQNSIIRTDSTAGSAVLLDPTFGTSDLHDCRFVQAGTGHAVQIDGTTTITLTNITGLNATGGYGADTTTSAGLYFSATTGSITVNLSGTSTTPTYRTAGVTVTFVSSYTLTLEGLPTGVQVTIVNSSTRAELQNSTSTGADVTYDHSGGETVDVMFMANAYDPNVSDLYDLLLPSADSSIPISLISDPNYVNP